MSEPLGGKYIVNTRAVHQAEKLDKLLRERGAEPLAYPCIDILPPLDTSELDEALKSLETYDWLVLTSVNTVYTVAGQLAALNITPDWSQVKVAAVGSSTAKAIQKRLNTSVDLIPGEFVAEGLAAALNLSEGQRVLLPQSEIARSVLQDTLREQGADVHALAAYRTHIGSGGVDLPRLLQVGQVDALTFTSSSTAENCVKRLGYAPDIPAACIGPITADTAREQGFQTIIMPEIYTLAAMVQALADYFK